MPNTMPEQFNEDASKPLLDLTSASPRSLHDALFAYCMADIDDISLELGIPWKKEKDVPFQNIFPFTGFSWNISAKMVSLSDAKKTKYLAVTEEWNSSSTHTLAETRKLYRKLLHACQIIPKGKILSLSTIMQPIYRIP